MYEPICEGPWAVAVSTGNWVILNRDTGATKTIGPPGGRVNNYEKAIALANSRNKAAINKPEQS